ncbi:hydroxymethylglutaryl-CoA lyase [Thalassotalea maritima]|uniref:hydroxymethylglutaryl-CoA lyase n=1 Tax=Thalassotalea maritima TaxID=3242416 RepID=UPI003526CABC
MPGQYIQITDVGPRDGLQNHVVSLSAKQRAEMVNDLLHCGLKRIEVGAFVSAKAVPNMAGSEQIFPLLEESDCRFQALIVNPKGYQRAKAVGAKHLTMVICASEAMNQKNTGTSIVDAMAQTKQMIRQGHDDNITISCCIAVAWHCPFSGPTPTEQVVNMVRALDEAGAHSIVLADTIGAANPQQVSDLLALLTTVVSVDKLACHFHDTRAMALANVYAALQHGIRQFDASLGGLGGCPFAPGATGNVATEDVVMMLEQMGYQTGIDLNKLMQVSDKVGAWLDDKIGGRADTWRQLQRHRKPSMLA